jgi:hypothetical protein
MAKPAKKKFELLVEINDIKSAQSAARQGTGACVIIIAFTAVMMFVLQASQGTAAFPVLDPIITAISIMIYAGLAVMIYRMSRAASIAALMMYLLDRIAIFIYQAEQSRPIAATNWFVLLLFILAFTNSIRGTFAYHRFRKERQEAIQSEELVDQSKS